MEITLHSFNKPTGDIDYEWIVVADRQSVAIVYSWKVEIPKKTARAAAHEYFPYCLIERGRTISAYVDHSVMLYRLQCADSSDHRACIVEILNIAADSNYSRMSMSLAGKKETLEAAFNAYITSRTAHIMYRSNDAINGWVIAHLIGKMDSSHAYMMSNIIGELIWIDVERTQRILPTWRHQYFSAINDPRFGCSPFNDHYQTID